MKRFVCPDCGTGFKYPARRAGKAITCGGCGKPHTLPADGPPASPVLAPAAGGRSRVIRYAVIGLLVLGAAAVGVAHFWALMTGADKEAAGIEVERQLGDLAPFALLRPTEEQEKNPPRETTVNLDNPGLGSKLGLDGKLVVIELQTGTVARRVTGGLRPDRQARNPDDVKYVVHVAKPERAKTARGTVFEVSLLVYDYATRRVVKIVRFTKSAPGDKPPKELDDGIADYLNG